MYTVRVIRNYAVRRSGDAYLTAGNVPCPDDAKPFQPGGSVWILPGWQKRAFSGYGSTPVCFRTVSAFSGIPLPVSGKPPENKEIINRKADTPAGIFTEPQP